MLFSFILIFNIFNNRNIEKKIIIGLDINVPPMGFKSENGEIVGFDIDLANEVFKSDYDEVIFQPIDWDSKEFELNSNKIDVIWNGLSETPDRKESMLLTKPYLKNRQVILVRKNSEINSLEDLKNKIICVQKGSTGADSLAEHKISGEIKQTVELENMVNCLNEVETGKSDATIVDEVVAKYYLNKLGEDKFKILDQELSSEFYVIAVKKENYKLKEFIESKLDGIYKSGKASDISKKWFGQDIFYWQNENSSKNSSKKSLNFLTPILDGLKQTLLLFVIVLVLSMPLGLLLFRLQKLRFGIIIKYFINLMRGTPLLLQLLFIFYGIPYLPFIGEFLAIKSRFLAGILTFVLNYSAYFAEIFRSGFLSIDKGQYEAAKLLGIGKFKLFFKILLPQAMKICMPSICNEAVTLIKDTSLIFAIGVQELLSNTKNIVNSTANIMPYIVAFGIYLTICLIIVFIFKKLETKFKF
jgi:polar amino acid transport system substrate-binding protein